MAFKCSLLCGFVWVEEEGVVKVQFYNFRGARDRRFSSAPPLATEKPQNGQRDFSEYCQKIDENLCGSKVCV